MIFFAIAVFVTGKVDATLTHRVPLFVDTNNNVAMNATDLTTGRVHIITMETIPFDSSSEFLITTLDGSQVLLEPLRDRHVRTSLTFHGMNIQLVRQFNSVSVVRLPNNGYELLLEATEDAFRERCVANSIVRSYESRNLLGVGYSSDFNRAPAATGQFVVHYGTDFVAEVPHEFYDHIIHVLTRRGAVRRDDTVIFRDCRRGTLILALPVLNVMLEDGGFIKLFVDDYISFDSDGTCELKLKRSPSPEDRVWSINPFAIPGINIRRTRLFIEFCDSNN